MSGTKETTGSFPLSYEAGSTVKSFRRQFGIKQSEFAHMVGVDGSLVSKIESRAVRSSSRKTIEGVAYVIGCDPISLIDVEKSPMQAVSNRLVLQRLTAIEQRLDSLINPGAVEDFVPPVPVKEFVPPKD